MSSKLTKLNLSSKLAKNKQMILVSVGLFMLFGMLFLFISRAATPSFSIEPESTASNVQSPATRIDDTTASGGKAIAFGTTAPPSGDCKPTTAPDGSVPTSPQTPCRYGLLNGPSGTWNFDWWDEFGGTSLDLTKWRPNYLGGTDTAITKASNSSMTNCEDPAQTKVNGGTLKLTLDLRSCTATNGITYTHASGYASTHADKVITGSFYVETKMYMPPANGTIGCANWAGIWTNGVHTGGAEWPMFLENDVMECLEGFAAANVHAGRAKDNDEWKKPIGNIGQTSGWHTFGASLERRSRDCSATPNTPDSALLTYYYNGVQLGSPYETCYKNTGQFIMLQNDIKPSSLDNTLPSTVEFDYVRIWTR